MIAREFPVHLRRLLHLLRLSSNMKMDAHIFLGNEKGRRNRAR